MSARSNNTSSEVARPGGSGRFQTDKSAAIYFTTLASSRVYEYILSIATQKQNKEQLN